MAGARHERRLLGVGSSAMLGPAWGYVRGPTPHFPKRRASDAGLSWMFSALVRLCREMASTSFAYAPADSQTSHS